MNISDRRELLEAIMEDDSLPPFSRKQWDALCGDIEMTQELYNEILDLCCEYTNFAEYFEIRQSFPAFNTEHNKHFAEKYGFMPAGKFGGVIEFEQFDFILEKSFRENGICIDNDRIIEILDGMCQGNPC